MTLLRKSRKPLDGLKLVRSVFPRMTEGEAGYVLWNCTGWPSFYRGDDPEAYFRAQLLKLKREKV